MQLGQRSKRYRFGIWKPLDSMMKSQSNTILHIGLNQLLKYQIHAVFLYSNAAFCWLVSDFRFVLNSRCLCWLLSFEKLTSIVAYFRCFKNQINESKFSFEIPKHSYAQPRKRMNDLFKWFQQFLNQEQVSFFFWNYICMYFWLVSVA